MSTTDRAGLVPVLSKEELAAIDEEIAHAPHPAAVAVDALRVVQAHRGWVSDESLRAVAHHLHLSADELDGIATFYNLIFRRPVGERVILVCNSVSCWIRGCDRVCARIGAELGIRPGETSADNRFTLLPVTCLGACDRAPALMIGDELHGDVDEQGIPGLLAGETP